MHRSLSRSVVSGAMQVYCMRGNCIHISLKEKNCQCCLNAIGQGYSELWNIVKRYILSTIIPMSLAWKQMSITSICHLQKFYLSETAVKAFLTRQTAIRDTMRCILYLIILHAYAQAEHFQVDDNLKSRPRYIGHDMQQICSTCMKCFIDYAGRCHQVNGTYHYPAAFRICKSGSGAGSSQL